MPRPLRICYPNAFYHVMNRGRGRRDIFHDKKYFLTFLNILSEANQKFGCVVHAYCLMSNHYHLVIETPKANLSCIMRHINGLYTQRYNRLRKTDGPLFRGRFKAILIDEDSYLLQLSRYVHRNPISVKDKLVRDLKDYRWSSYPAFINSCPTPDWLNKNKTFEILESENDLEKYKAFVFDESYSHVEELYGKKTLPKIIGDTKFKRKIESKIDASISEKEIRNNFHEHVTSNEIVRVVSRIFSVKESSIIDRNVVRSKNNFPRKLAMYLCQIYARKPLLEIKDYFNLKNVGSVSHAIHSVKKNLSDNEFRKELEKVKNALYVIQRT